MEGFIKISRKLLKWEWYDDINTCRLFLHCLLKANWKQTKWHGIVLQPGQFVTSLPSLAKETKLSIQNVRTSLSHLKSTGELTDKGYSKYRVITVNNWSLYQETNRQLTDNQQTTNRQLTSAKEYKEKKEGKKRGSPKPTFNSFNQRVIDYSELESLIDKGGHDNDGLRNDGDQQGGIRPGASERRVFD